MSETKKRKNNKSLYIMMSTYNGEKFLDEQLKSIYQQETEVTVTVYIRDDGSKDGTKAIIDKWSNSLQIVFIQGENAGPANSFWELLHYVPLDADYYAFADQDDVWDANKIQSAVSRLGFSPIPGLYFSNARLVDKNLKFLNINTQKRTPVVTIPSQIVCGSALGCTMVFNVEAIKVVRKAKITTVAMHDWIVMLHVLATGKVIYDPIPRISYRQHDNNVVAKSKKTFQQKIKATYQLWVKNSKKNLTLSAVKDLLDNYGETMDEDLKTYLFWLLNYKNNFAYKFKLLLDKRTTTATSNKALRSYQIRVLLGYL